MAQISLDKADCGQPKIFSATIFEIADLGEEMNA